MDQSVGRGYRRAALEDQWARYLPAVADTSVTSVTSVTGEATADPAAPVAGVTPLAGRQWDRRLPREDEEDPGLYAENPL